MQKKFLNFIIFYIYILLVSFNSLSPPATTPAPASTAVQVSLGKLLQPAPPLIVVPLPSLPSPFPLVRATARDRGGLRTSSCGGRRRPPLASSQRRPWRCASPPAGSATPAPPARPLLGRPIHPNSLRGEARSRGGRRASSRAEPRHGRSSAFGCDGDEASRAPPWRRAFGCACRAEERSRRPEAHAPASARAGAARSVGRAGGRTWVAHGLAAAAAPLLRLELASPRPPPSCSARQRLSLPPPPAPPSSPAASRAARMLPRPLHPGVSASPVDLAAAPPAPALPPPTAGGQRRGGPARGGRGGAARPRAGRACAVGAGLLCSARAPCSLRRASSLAPAAEPRAGHRPASCLPQPGASSFLRRARRPRWSRGSSEPGVACRKGREL